ncbi:VCBS repeat-containing protein [Maribacter confluentis]|uniref:VCBS repeat-containing protein n=1 Tax=Maribacter confluentis TaxID=1656093 RepID=A0ABT8RNI1_9FLAO|nr:VCBS repeat-containing protein [Maribacter confluentis]MDO1512470.1 VCBS repeat-containing protein [Maribacter confluentis]
MKNRLSILFLLLVIASCTNKGGEVFTKRSPKDSGITFENTLTDSKDLSILDYLYYYNGGGVAIGDINNDSLPDIFFSGNQVKNKLYLNKGNLEFEDISKSAGVEGNSSWNTGAVMGDINGDGLLDIYVCAVVGLNGFNGYNELYINQGNNTFMESAAQYGLDFESYSSSAAFLDYDLDGDLDIYLLNHAVHSQDSYGTASLRTKRTYETGDKLLRNDNGKFTDVSEEAGIYGGINGYGLGIAVSDFNQDGYPDLYIGNDFHEDDYYYLNNGDGTFKESLREYFGHTTRFSMGSDVADINHDGLPDLISLDMLAGDEKVLKSSDGDDDIQIHKLKTGKFGYYNQYTRNMLFINQPNGTFLETALLSGVAATDWSWSALFGDYDQDGEQDLYISNGIPKRPNNLDYINYISNENIKQKINNTNLVDQKALTLMPSGYVSNMVFKGAANLKFIDESQNWLEKDSIISGATAYGDLDNDGDLDLVTNNLNHPSLILENTTNAQRNWLKIKLSYQKGNNFGIGTKIYAYTNGVQQFKELYTVRGFQASSEPVIHFGFNTVEKIDSIKIVWPNKKYQTLKNIPVNQTLYIQPENTKTVPVKAKNGASLLFKKSANNLGIDYVHIEDSYSDYLRQKLIPYQISDRGPAVSIGDLNGDGTDDIFFGGAKYVASQIYIQGDTLFQQKQFPKVKNDSIKEDISSLIADFNADGNNDLMIGTGGADFFGQMKPLTNSYYTNNGQTMVEAELPQLYENTAVLLKLDFDHDNDIDVWVGNQSITADYGNKPNSYLLENTNGSFSISNQNVFKNLGLVTDALIADFNNDGWEDIIVIGEWMSPKFFQNNNGIFTEVNVLHNDKINGLWQAITSFDIDADGDLDFLLGNWGTNTKFSATQEHPMRMYYGDLDLNGSTETVISTYKSGKNYPIDGLKELSSQLVFLRKKFTDYSSFAGKSIEEVLGKEAIKNTEILEVHTLNSGFLRNDNGKFSFIPFNFELQTAPIMDFLEYDFDGDTKTEVLAAGNYFGVKPYHGRFDSFPGAMIAQGPAVSLTGDLGLDLKGKSIRNMQTITFKGHTYLLLTFNNEAAQVYQILKQ